MRRQVVTFQNRASFNDLVARVMNVGCDVRLHGRYNMGGNRPIYVMLLLRSKDEWLLYKSCASELGLKGAEVVAEIAPLPNGDITVHETSVTTKEIVVDLLRWSKRAKRSCMVLLIGSAWEASW
jgi:hypothetical protein